MSIAAIATSALVAGLLGSLHCTGMCGPLAVAGCSKGRGVDGATGYFAGRFVAYATLGAVVGHLGKHAFCILPMNAAHAIGRNRGAITIQIAPHDADFNAIVVQDDGPGFDPEVLPKVFEPLVTTRASGVGLGLALVRSVAERHRGRAQAENATGGGALVRLLLPSREAQIAPES